MPRRPARTKRRRPTASPTRQRAPRRSRRRRPTGGFVGRDGSPILDHYRPATVASPSPPPTSVPLPSTVPVPPRADPGTSSRPATDGPSSPPPRGLLSLDRPFDLDAFSRLLGETAIRIEVPKENLAEVLRRVTDFMGFGIYVYSIRVRPAADEMLRRFVIELQRVDYSADAKGWVEFQEKGRADSPFGPGPSG